MTQVQRSGQITVAAAGTAVQGPSINGKLFQLNAHPDNTDVVWWGRDSTGADVSSTTGSPLAAGGPAAIVAAGSLLEIWFDADVSGSKICWAILEE